MLNTLDRYTSFYQPWRIEWRSGDNNTHFKAKTNISFQAECAEHLLSPIYSAYVSISVPPHTTVLCYTILLPHCLQYHLAIVRRETVLECGNSFFLSLVFRACLDDQSIIHK